MVLYEFGARLEMRDLPRPKAGPGEVLIKVRACGVCGTDLKMRAGKLKLKPSLPHVMGHEPAGEICEIGQGVRNLELGDRVAVYFYQSWHKCKTCDEGFETSCAHQKGQIGFSTNGAFAEYLVVPAENVGKLADHVSYSHGAIIADAIATTLQALRDCARLKRGETVLIVGIGGLGLHAIQIAKLLGARVIAVDTEDKKLDLARKYGADHVVNARSPDILESVRTACKYDGPDVALDLVGNADSIQLCILAAKAGARVVLVGYDPAAKVLIEPFSLVARQLVISGSRAASLQTFRDAVELINEEKIKPVVTNRFPAVRVNEALETLHAGKVSGRAVIEWGELQY